MTKDERYILLLSEMIPCWYRRHPFLADCLAFVPGAVVKDTIFYVCIDGTLYKKRGFSGRYKKVNGINTEVVVKTALFPLTPGEVENVLLT